MTEIKTNEPSCDLGEIAADVVEEIREMSKMIILRNERMMRRLDRCIAGLKEIA